MHLLPLDRRTIFSRNVFCGATSPLLPPAMVILPAAWGPGGVPARLLRAAGSWAPGPRAIPARSAPCAPRGPGRPGAAAPSGCHPRALFAPPSLRPASQSTRAGLASPQPLPGGRREPRCLSRGAPYWAQPPPRPPPACGRVSGGLPQRPGSGGPRWAEAGLAAPPSGHSPGMGSGCALGWRGRCSDPCLWWIHYQRGYREPWGDVIL